MNLAHIKSLSLFALLINAAAMLFPVINGGYSVRQFSVGEAGTLSEGANIADPQGVLTLLLLALAFGLSAHVCNGLVLATVVHKTGTFLRLGKCAEPLGDIHNNAN